MVGRQLSVMSEAMFSMIVIAGHPDHAADAADPDRTLYTTRAAGSEPRSRHGTRRGAAGLPRVALAFVFSVLPGLSLPSSRKSAGHDSERLARPRQKAVAYDFGEQRRPPRCRQSFALATLLPPGRNRQFRPAGERDDPCLGGITALQLAPGGRIAQVVRAPATRR